MGHRSSKIGVDDGSHHQVTYDYTVAASDGSGVEMAEFKGSRPSQQDSLFVGIVGNAVSLSATPAFLIKEIGTIVADHKTCRKGTTLCTAIVKTDGKDVRITAGNLGDSRAALIIRHKDGSYESIVLTEDYSLDNPAFAAAIAEKGGVIVDGRVKGINMAGAIGDADVGCLVTDPDVFNYRLSGFLRPGETMKDISASLIVACDGMWDLMGGKTMGVDKQVTISKEKAMELKPGKSAGFKLDGFTFHLSRLKQKFDLEGGFTVGGVKVTNFAEGLARLVMEVGGSEDNVSIAHVPLVTKGVIKIKKTNPIMATVCDGHGTFPTSDRDSTPHPSSLLPESDRAIWDGSLVSHSVASQLYRAAMIRKIPGLLPISPAVTASSTVATAIDFEAFAEEEERREAVAARTRRATIVVSTSATPTTEPAPAAGGAGATAAAGAGVTGGPRRG